MIPFERIKKVRVDCDLAECSFLSVCGEMKDFNDTPQMIISNMTNAGILNELEAKFGIRTLALPDPVIQDQDSWCVVGHCSMVWSPGCK